MTSAPSAPAVHQRTWRVHGQVQGVGFRPFVYRLASDLGLSGTVRNDPAGVTIEAWADEQILDEFVTRLTSEAPALARIDTVRTVSSAPVHRAAEPFRIVESDHAPARRGRVTVDSAVCPDCLGELFDTRDRRHGHALINCTNCGPRYTIIRDLPYDRPLTTMAAFAMCDRCAAEYKDPADRRFHAQPTCCPRCGPQMRLVDHNGAVVDADPIRGAMRLLREGRIISMKGLGGYHLVADAANESAVARLRRGKKRDHKPFAVMARDVEAACRLAALSEDASELLRSPICPIVLAPRNDTDAVAPSVAPGSQRLGVMVPYTPMQHLLFAEGVGDVGGFVMTSANMSDDPLISDDEEARLRLAGISDALLTHDRPIERAVDDSIAIDAPWGVLPIRRGRGLVPIPRPLPVAAPRPGLCVGGELKSTVAVVTGDAVVLSQHLGDLTYSLAYRRFEKTIDDLLHLFDVVPEWIACDAHPQYLSHQYATKLAAGRGLDLIVVQHHHAHLASLLAEYGRTDRIIGLVCDGVGYGADGTAWGGEVLVGDLRGFDRVGHLRPLRLPGGDAAARDTTRCGLSWLTDLLGADTADHQAARRMIPDEQRRNAIFGLLQRDLNCPPSSGLGRLFDAAAALLGVCDYNHYEAMSGTLLEAAASRAVSQPGADGLIEIRATDGADAPFELDHRPLLQHLLDMMGSGAATETMAWLFHDAVADGLARAAATAAGREGTGTVALSGGVFCNTLLTELVATRLQSAKMEVLIHGAVPPSDGGIAFGQAAIAAASIANRNP
ncbi:MAG: carbamoyltransferase HypF [Planctomycetota bacterium]